MFFRNKNTINLDSDAPERPVTHLDLSGEVNGITSVRIERIVDSRDNKEPPFESVFQTYALSTEDGKTDLGYYCLDWRSPELSKAPHGSLVIKWITLPEVAKGYYDQAGQRQHGMGKDIYRFIALESELPAGMQGEELAPDYFLTAVDPDNSLEPESRGMWDSFVRSGEASRSPSGDYIFNTPVGSQVTAR